MFRSVVDAHRTAEDDNARVFFKPVGKRLTDYRPARFNFEAAGTQDTANAAGTGGLAMQYGQYS